MAGKTIESEIRFRDNAQLLSICQRIVIQVGRRVDESSPICDARLPDGSRVNVIAPPLSLDGPALTIRKFKKDKLTLDQLVKFGTITPEAATVLQIIGVFAATWSFPAARVPVKPRCSTASHAISMNMSVSSPARIRLNSSFSSACGAPGNPPAEYRRRGGDHHARSRQELPAYAPERIIVGEVRGPEVFDLLQAMNTVTTDPWARSTPIHRANACRVGIHDRHGRLQPARENRARNHFRSVDVIVQAARLRDGSRRITHITKCWAWKVT